MPTLKKELLDKTDILNVAATSSLPGLNIPRRVKMPEGYSKTEMQLMDDIHVDAEFIPALEIKLVQGRNFRKENIADQTNSVIINELAASKFGWQNPIGKTIKYSVGPDQDASATVIGVVKDFHLSSMHRVIEPLFIGNNPKKLKQIIVRVRQGQISNTLPIIQEQWKTVNPNHPFRYQILEDKYDTYFRTLQEVIDVLTFFSTLAIILACLGIFALATFIAERRTKEIGIRKVLGESTLGVVFLINFELLKYVLIAICLIFPYIYFTRDLLSHFLPYMGDMNYFIYGTATALVFIISLISISYQSIRAATADPVEALRYE
jgi:putative ABC transport system permease protein